MTGETSRRDFLRGRYGRAAPEAVRPPGADPDVFTKACTDCRACLDACPEGIIVADGKGKASVDFALGACTFCGDCAEACPTGALKTDLMSDWPWRARVAETCLSMNGVVCRSCQDACDAQAIRFRLQTSGRSTPEIDIESCTGCGACAGSCPAGAVSFRKIPPRQMEAAE
ncbi:ferredoxin-type protein NapF [Ruegeria sediminis]|uniref:Ferredoxin-type protein NapF n=1 Tax=Ruegeria sediminis TaxID=2583820 RepID=A0ABY2WUD7_9RHOB|nr:ferredoxin-type protein NapF [Ruegeria sediminis]TMV05613.1 ferredoxin-type protein NapF [Ruegeria sediminis]